MLNWDDESKPAQQAANPEGPAPVNVDDKRVINGETDINQLAPFKYPWAWEYFMNANKNHWTPLDVNMAQDVHDYHHRLTAPHTTQAAVDHRHVVFQRRGRVDIGVHMRAGGEFLFAQIVTSHRSAPVLRELE